MGQARAGHAHDAHPQTVALQDDRSGPDEQFAGLTVLQIGGQQREPARLGQSPDSRATQIELVVADRAGVVPHGVHERRHGAAADTVRRQFTDRVAGHHVSRVQQQRPLDVLAFARQVSGQRREASDRFAVAVERPHGETAVDVVGVENRQLERAGVRGLRRRRGDRGQEQTQEQDQTGRNKTGGRNWTHRRHDVTFAAETGLSSKERVLF